MYGDYCACDIGRFHSYTLNLACFDSETAEFQLGIETTKEFDFAGRQPPGLVSGTVHALSCSERTGDEALCCKFGLVEVTECKAVPCDA